VLPAAAGPLTFFCGWRDARSILAVGIDHVVVIDLHHLKSKDFSRSLLTALSAVSILCEALRGQRHRWKPGPACVDGREVIVSSTR
jgi:hypothetical protein